MRTLQKKAAFAAAMAAALALLAGCELYQGITVAWDITGVGPGVFGTTRVSYAVQNLGKVDLSGVNLQIGVNTDGSTTYYPYTAWTSSFSLGQNQILYGSLDVPTPATGVAATVLSVDMDKPSN